MPRFTSVLFILLATLLVLSACDDIGDPGPDFETSILTVRADNPEDVEIDVSPADEDGAGAGTTPFSRVYEKDASVTLTAPANSEEGTVFAGWEEDGSSLSSDPEITITLSDDRTVTAVYQDADGTFRLSVESRDPDSGVQIDLSPADVDEESAGTTPFDRTYDPGTEVTLTAPESANNRTFGFWEEDGDAVSDDPTIDVAMTGNRTLTAVYIEEGQTATLTISSRDPDSGVDISVDPADENGDTDGTTTFERTYAAGAQVTLAAPETTVNDRVFVRWELDGSSQPVNQREITVSMTGDREARAVYEAPAPVYTLSVTSSNPSEGVPIEVSPIDVNENGDGETTFERDYQEGTDVTLTAPQQVNGNMFVRWRLDGSDAAQGERSLTFEMTGDRTARAVYTSTPTLNELTVRSQNPDEGIAISVSPQDFDGVGDGTTEFTRRYEEGASVTLTAPEESGDDTVFARWVEGGQTISSDPEVTVSMTQGRLVTAVYEEPDQQFELTIESRAPDSGVAIDVIPDDVDGNGSGTTPFARTYLSGEDVTLTAASEAEGNDFVRWEIDGSSQPSGQQEITVSMTQDRVARAVYEESIPVFSVSINSENPSSGVQIGVEPPDEDGATDGVTSFTRFYEEGTTVTFTAPETTDDGREFVEWRLDGTAQAPGETALTFEVVQTHSVSARYAVPPPDPPPTATLIDTTYEVGGRPSGLPQNQMQRELGVLALSQSILEDGHVGIFHLRDGNHEALPDTYFIDVNDDGTADTEVTFSFTPEPGEVLLDLTAADEDVFLNPQWLPNRVYILLITEENLPENRGDDIDLSDFNAVLDYYDLE